MSYHDNRERILGLVGHIPENLSIINHEVLFQATSETMNFADRTQQQDLLRLALAQGSKVIVMDNISCLFTGVDEDKSREWEKVKPWLLDMRRHRISPVLVHHTGYDLTHMRGTSSREDAASWVIRLDRRKTISKPWARSSFPASPSIVAKRWCSITNGRLKPIRLSRIRSMFTTTSRTGRRSYSNGFGTD